MRAALLTAMAMATGGSTACSSAPPSPIPLYVASSAGPAVEALALREGLPPAVVISGASDRLALQIAHGARAALFLSASADAAARVARSAEATQDAPVWCDEVAVLVRSSSPIEDWHTALSRERVGLAEPSVPLGAYAAEAIAQLGEREGAAWQEALLQRTSARETSARSLLTRLRLGEVDAILGYRSQAVGASDVRALQLPVRIPTALYLVRLSDAPEAAAWAEVLRADAAFWQSWGYTPCPAVDADARPSTDASP